MMQYGAKYANISNGSTLDQFKGGVSFLLGFFESYSSTVTLLIPL